MNQHDTAIDYQTLHTGPSPHLPRRGHRPPMSLCPGCVADVAALRVTDG